MSDQFLGEVRIVSFNFAPQGWALCNGQLMQISQNQALYSLLGTTYGGNGQTTFALPDMRGRTPLHFGNQFGLGSTGGEVAHTLTLNEMPVHTHFPMGNNSTATQSDPAGHFWSNGGDNVYSSAAPNAAMRAGTVSNVGGSQAHENMSPFLVLNFIICLQGIFPTRD